MDKHTQGELKVIPARYSRKTNEMAFDICSFPTHNEIINICSILPKELCDNSYSGHLPNTNVSVEIANANAERIVKCWNNWDYVIEQLERIKLIYDNKEDAAGVIAKETLNKIYNL